MGCITMWSLNTTLTILFSLLLTIFSVGFCRCRSSLGVVLEWQTVHQQGCRFPVPVVQHTWSTMDSCLQPVAPGRAMVTAASLLAFKDTYEWLGQGHHRGLSWNQRVGLANSNVRGGLSCQAARILVPLSGDFASSQRLQGSCSLLLNLLSYFLCFFPLVWFVSVQAFYICLKCLS